MPNISATQYVSHYNLRIRVDKLELDLKHAYVLVWTLLIAFVALVALSLYMADNHAHVLELYCTSSEAVPDDNFNELCL